MPGLILGAIGGAGEAMQNVGSAMVKSQLDTDSKMQTNVQESDLALARAKALEDYKVATANTQRDAQAQRISTAAQPIIEQGIIAKATNARASQLPDYDSSDTSGPASFHGDATQALAGINAMPEGPDKQAALAQLRSNVAANRSNVGSLSLDDLTDDEKARFAPTASDMTTARRQAAIQTGDISPTDAAKLDQSSELGQAKLDATLAVANVRGDAMRDVAQARYEASVARTQAQYDAAMAKLEAKLSAAGGGNTDFDKKVKLLKDSGATPQDIANFIMERKQPSIEDLANGFLKSDPNAGTKKALTADEAIQKATTLRSLTRSLDTSDPTQVVVDANKRDAANPTAAPKVLKFDPATGTFH